VLLLVAALTLVLALGAAAGVLSELRMGG